MSIPSFLPSSFLPYLPRSPTSFHPLSPHDLLAHIAVLRELYLPPIHGGFDASDLHAIDDNAEDEEISEVSRARQRRFSAGLAETIEGLGVGLHLDVGHDTLNKVDEVVEDDLDVLSDDLRDDLSSEDDLDDFEGDDQGHLDPFERDWAEKWLSGLVRRSQGWIEEHEGEESGQDPIDMEQRDVEAVLRDATAVLAMMAGTSAAGSLTRHLLFPVHSTLDPHIKALQTSLAQNPAMSPETSTFLASLATSPTSPITPFFRARDLSTSPRATRPRASSTARSARSQAEHFSTSPETVRTTASGTSTSRRRRRRRRAVIPILLHDAPMADHLSVGVQTWGSAILLGREISSRPDDFGLFPDRDAKKGIRILELGAGTGLLAILCRKLLMLFDATREEERLADLEHLILATDFHPDVLANLKVCIDLNFPPQTGAPRVEASTGVDIDQLDWRTFPTSMEGRAAGTLSENGPLNDMAVFDEPFDLVLASDCVYDPTHAELLYQVASWTLRLPDPSQPGDTGGTFHILSPLRPTFTPEIESIDVHFPPHAATGSTPLQPSLGLGRARGLRLGTRGEGKRSVKGRKGEGRVDEVSGYWWWEVGWK